MLWNRLGDSAPGSADPNPLYDGLWKLPQWSPDHHKHCDVYWTCAICTRYLEILNVRNSENLHSSCRSRSCSVLNWWMWQHSPILVFAVCYLSLHTTMDYCWTPELSNMNGKSVKYMSELPKLPRITSVDYEFPNRKWFLPELHVPLCSNLMPPSPDASSTTSSVLCLPQPVFCVWGRKYTALSGTVSEEHNCSTATCRRKCSCEIGYVSQEKRWACSRLCRFLQFP
jgi:hypothetical protein